MPYLIKCITEMYIRPFCQSDGYMYVSLEMRDSICPLKGDNKLMQHFPAKYLPKEPKPEISSKKTDGVILRLIAFQLYKSMPSGSD